MYRTLSFLAIWLVFSTNGASYQGYDSSTRYPNYQQRYSTITNLNQYPYKTGTYGSDIANFPEATRYPNYSPGYSTSGYNTYSTSGYNSYPSSGLNSYNSYPTQSSGIYQGSYTTQRYGAVGYGNTGYGSAGYGKGYTPYEVPFMGDYGKSNCINRSPQTAIWVENLMGMWYGVEFVQHLGADSSLDYARTCIVIHISEPTEAPSTEYQLHHVQHINAKFRQEYRHLRLLWDEAGETVEYSLYFRNDSAGYWQVFNGQNGTMALKPTYQQFSGTVQVMKAVNDHLVLTFCQEASLGRQGQLYSVLFSRDPGSMPRWEIESVHALLQNKQLSVSSRRMVCGNSADRPFYGVFLSAILLALTFAATS